MRMALPSQCNALRMYAVRLHRQVILCLAFNVTRSKARNSQKDLFSYANVAAVIVAAVITADANTAPNITAPFTVRA